MSTIDLSAEYAEMRQLMIEAGYELHDDDPGWLEYIATVYARTWLWDLIAIQKGGNTNADETQ